VLRDRNRLNKRETSNNKNGYLEDLAFPSDVPPAVHRMESAGHPDSFADLGVK
jgi:hypothetical protein